MASKLPLAFRDLAFTKAAVGLHHSWWAMWFFCYWFVGLLCWQSRGLNFFVMCHRCGFQIAIGLPWFHISKGGKWLHHRWWAMWFFMGFMGLLEYIHGLRKSYLLCIKGAASRLSLAFLDFTLARAGGWPSQSMVGHVVLHLFGLLAVTWLTNVLFVTYHRFVFQVAIGLL